MSETDKFIDFIREKETISRLFTLESTLYTIYAKSHYFNTIEEFREWLEPRFKNIEKAKNEYSKLILEDPTKDVISCLQSFEPI